MSEQNDYERNACITWESDGFVHQCHYRPGHKTRHHCHCGTFLVQEPEDA